jgi:hypothetical protein
MSAVRGCLASYGPTIDRAEMTMIVTISLTTCTSGTTGEARQMTSRISWGTGSIPSLKVAPTGFSCPESVAESIELSLAIGVCEADVAGKWNVIETKVPHASIGHAVG